MAGVRVPVVGVTARVALGAATLLLAAAAIGAIALAVRASLRADPAALLRGE